MTAAGNDDDDDGDVTFAVEFVSPPSLPECRCPFLTHSLELSVAAVAARQDTVLTNDEKTKVFLN